MGMSTKEILIGAGILVAFLALIGGGAIFSGTSSDDVRERFNPQDSLDRIEQGVSADLSLAAYDRTADSATQVAADMYVWETGGEEAFYLGQNAGDTSTRTIFDVVTGDQYEAIAFNDQYPYAEAVTGDVNSETVRENLDVYEAAATSDLSLTLNNEDGDEATSAISLGSEEQYQFESLQVALDNNNVGYNPHIVTVGYSDNVEDVHMTGASEVEVPETGADAVSSDNEKAFIPNEFNAQEGEPFMRDWESVETGTLVVTAGQNGTSTGDPVTVAVQDMVPYINGAQELAYGVEDDASSANEVGVQPITTSVSLE